MINVTVEVIGPGECIGNEMLVIEKALRDAGYPVLVKDEYPPKDHVPEMAPPGWHITLIAQHCPWGG